MDASFVQVGLIMKDDGFNHDVYQKEAEARGLVAEDHGDHIRLYGPSKKVDIKK